MELSAGYKLTEVGVIPEEWHVGNLQSVCGETITYGIVQCGPHMQNGVPYIRVSDMNSEQLDVAGMLRTSPAIASQFARSRVNEGDVVYALRGKIGEVRKVDPAVAGANLTQGTARLSPNDRMNSDFLLWSLRTQGALKQGDLAAKGSTFREITLEALRQIQLAVPPLQEQRAIATALSDVDALLAKLDQLIAKKRDLKQATMQQLLTGQTRLPGFDGEWGVKPMKALGQTYGGLTGKTKDDFGHGSARYIPFMNVMTDTVIDPDWLEQVDIAATESQNLAKKGDLFFNGSSETPEEVGFCAVLLEDVQRLYLNSFCFGFRFNAGAEVEGLFFAYWFRGTAGRQAMSVLAQGATRYNIAKSAFMRLEVPQPSRKEQVAIATVLSDMDAELSALEARRDKTKAIKQGMMQELLTGRIRLV
jgi:type I restriction enzyme, S subunit